MTDQPATDQQTFTFQAEIQQLLDILIHSLYTDREIFLRELISNASDALNRMQFELLTNRDVLDPDAELYIEVKGDADTGTITISDTGIGLTREDMVNNLGVIARSGAKAFIEAMRSSQNTTAQDVIGQFGVGFYSVFMVADKVRVVSRNFEPDGQAWAWESAGDSQFTIEPAEREARGTDIIITLKEDAKDFANGWRLKDIIRKHSDYIAFPIYVNDEEEPTNKRSAIWRQDPKEITDEQYDEFYKSLTMDFQQPLKRFHIRADVPLQFYALLYVPNSREPNMFSPRKEPGLKLYARKVLIQEYSKDLLPEYLSFIQGVVDSEDLPLNVSRESVQANTIMTRLKKTITNRVLNDLKRMIKNDRETYLKIFEQFGRFLKQGVVIDSEAKEDLQNLLLFPTTNADDVNTLVSLEEYVDRFAENQSDIYYVVADDFFSARRSPHLDAFRQRGIEVLYMTDPVDAMMLMGLDEYRGHKLRNVDEADIDLSEIGDLQSDTAQQAPVTEDAFESVRDRFKAVLGSRVRDVRQSKSLVAGAARLISDETGGQRQMFRINRLLDREYRLPVKVLELNPRHPLVHNLAQQINMYPDNPVIELVIEQMFETALLQDGIHPDPASMAQRITALMEAATGSPLDQLDYGESDRDDRIYGDQPENDPHEQFAAMAEALGGQGYGEADYDDLEADDYEEYVDAVNPIGGDVNDEVAGDAQDADEDNLNEENITDAEYIAYTPNNEFEESKIPDDHIVDGDIADSHAADTLAHEPVSADTLAHQSPAGETVVGETIVGQPPVPESMTNDQIIEDEPGDDTLDSSTLVDEDVDEDDKPADPNDRFRPPQQ
jgi:HSP90 family molecular chaperone